MISPESPNQFAHHSPEQTSGIEDDLTDNPARPYIEIRADDIRLGDVSCPPEWRESIDSHESEEQIDLARKLVQNSIVENQKRVESVSEKPANTGMTICIPLAIRYETPETIERLMQQIIGASNGVENGVNVLIWANAKYKDHEELLSVEQEVITSYKELRQQLQRLEQESDTVTISTAIDEIVPDEQFSMSQIRNNYMEAITGRLMDGEIEENRPIVWLDADTTRIRPNTLSTIQKCIQKYPQFYHPDIDYSLEWLEGKRPEEWDVNSKLLFIDEMAQREYKRVALEKGFTILDRAYPDESGLSFTLSKFVTSGGLDTSDPIDESRHLLMRAGCASWGIRWLDNDKRNKVGIEVSARRTYQEMSSLPPDVNLVPYRTFSHEKKYTMSSDQDSNPTRSQRTLDPEATASFLLKKRRGGKAYTEADRAARKVTERMLANKVLNIEGTFQKRND